MNSEKVENEDLYGILDFSKSTYESILPILIKIFKREKIQDCIEFLAQVQNQRQVGTDKEQMLYVGQNNLNRITDVLKKIKDHEFSEQNYSLDKQEEIKQDLIAKISQDKRSQNYQNYQFIQLPLMRGTYSADQILFIYLFKLKLIQSNNLFKILKQEILHLEEQLLFDVTQAEHGINMNQAKLFNYEKSLASCSDDRSIRFCDVKTGKLIQVIQSKREVKQISYSPNSTTLASCSNECIVGLRQTKFQNQKLNQIQLANLGQQEFKDADLQIIQVIKLLLDSEIYTKFLINEIKNRACNMCPENLGIVLLIFF
ncbi:unnamed protein product [Paramecium octaurelia]|uniref:Uncharacterized protein n=1 Tax=Paramecium octaurelia TaxID=43137 RepID=A0A8S1UIX0_PAROT|nr:unnamed protein product [Paramecium octaurelia]